jgi:Glycosyl transferases group 1
MTYHIALSRPFNLAQFNLNAQMGKSPRHTMWDLSQALNATVHQPEQHLVQSIDRLAAKLIGQPEHWALARSLVHQLNQNDTVFCTCESVGFPLAILASKQSNRPKLAVYVMQPENIRVRVTSELLGLAQTIDLFLTNTQIKAETLCRNLRLPDHRVHVVREQTDTQFFSPGAVSIHKTRPILASAGLEQRDYKTLAAATHDLDIDVKICAVSPNASSKTRVAFPEIMPQNMTPHPQDWQQFRQLYRNADIVVVSLLNNPYSAGLTTLMEALACRRPVIITRTTGLAERFIDAGVVTGVNPGDAAGMREAISQLLNNPAMAAAQAQKGYELLLKEHSSEHYVEDMVAQLQQISQQELAPQPSYAVTSA